MTTTMIKELAEDPQLFYRYTVDEYHRMIPNGIIEEGAPFELLDGHVVRKIRNATGEDPMTVGLEHVLVVQILADLNEQLKASGCHVRAQQPVTLPPYDEPEPDAAVVQGTLNDYADHNPGADEILCLIEVADASLRRDRGYKRQLYASSGVSMYVIVNLIERVVEVYTRPLKGKKRYGHVATLTRNQTLTIPAARGKGVTVPVNTLLRRADRTTR
jgi:Uma2 family endonuclease